MNRFRFRLRTLLIATAVVAVFFGLAPRAYNCYVWRPVEQELTAWLATVAFKAGDQDGAGIVIAGVTQRSWQSSPMIFQIGTHPLEIAEWEAYENSMASQHKAFYIAPPGQWISKKEQALEVWRENYLEHHGWRWPL